jgi:hypothetical protein
MEKDHCPKNDFVKSNCSDICLPVDLSLYSDRYAVPDADLLVS